jgi:hypothetical protein
MDRRHPYAGMAGQQQAAAIDKQATAAAIDRGDYRPRLTTQDATFAKEQAASQRTDADLAQFKARLNGPQPVTAPAADPLDTPRLGAKGRTPFWPDGKPKRSRKPKAEAAPEVAAMSVLTAALTQLLDTHSRIDISDELARISAARFAAWKKERGIE